MLSLDSNLNYTEKTFQFKSEAVMHHCYAKSIVQREIYQVFVPLIEMS